MATVLEVRDLWVAYGPIVVVSGVSFSVPAGTIVALIGPNGAGKSTTLRTISGLKIPQQGSIQYLGERIDGLSPASIVRRGIAHVPEGRHVFRNLTVYENLLMGTYAQRDRRQTGVWVEEMYALFPRLQERRKQPAGSLSGGEQQMLAFARALVSRPKLLLLDEPSMGLAPVLVDMILETVAKIRLEGITVLLVEQNASLALEIADHAYVLETGRVALSGAADELRANPRVQESYLGV
ncbi:MAG: ABC transporter ATP-binding protein [Chloroflexi bacterium]|nr:ABC transporter ATP-binding protein [Chloroflexota bacterium]